MHRLPESPDQWTLLAALVILALAYDYFITRRMRKRNRAGKCARCGRPLDADESHNVDLHSRYDDTMGICPRCAAKRYSIYRIAGYGLILMLCGITTAVVIMVVKNHGIDRSQIGLVIQYLLTLAIALGVIFALMRTDTKDRKRKRRRNTPDE